MGQDYRRIPDEDDDHLDTMPRRTVSTNPPTSLQPGGAGEIVQPTASPPERRAASAERTTLYVPAEGAPPPPAPAPPRRGTGNACIWLLALAAMVVLACGLLGAGALNNGINGLFGMVPRFPSVAGTPVVSIQPQGPSVVEQVQALSRLETARYTVKTIMTGQSVGSVIGIVPGNLTTDKILFLAYGNVVAGVDLSKLRPEDVQVVSNTVTMRLPAAEIFNYTLDNSKSTVYDRQTGIFTQANPNLETEVRQRAEQEIRTQALEDGVLKTAQDNAETTLRTLLRGLHYDNVTFLPPNSVPPTLPDLLPTPTSTP